MAADEKELSPTVIYIMGRGHSGSTILDILLGNADQIVSVGELLASMGNLDHDCSCGRTMRECDYWSKVTARFESSYARSDSPKWEDLVALSRRYNIVTKFPQVLLGWPSRNQLSSLRTQTLMLYRAIALEAGTNFVVDSSKEVTRALFLTSIRTNVRLIHLVRNGEEILASDLWRMQNQEGFQFLRRRWKARHLHGLFLILNTFAWIAGNLLAEIVRLKAPDKVLRVQYENLCADPVGELRRIESFIDGDLTALIDLVEADGPLKVGHNLGGNRIQARKEIRFRPNSRKNTLPRMYRWIFRFTAFPLLCRYGLK